MSEMWRGVILGLSGVLGLAIISVLVSQRSQTSGVISSAAGGLSSIIQAATSPVTGSGGNILGGGVSGASNIFGGASAGLNGNNLTLDSLGLGTLNTYQ